MTWLKPWKPSLRDSVSNRLYFEINASLSHSLSLPHRPSLTLSLSRFSAPLSHPLLPLRHHIAHYADHWPSSPNLNPLSHPFLLLRQTLTTSPIILFTNHPLSLTLFSHSVKRSSLRRSPSSLTQSMWHSSPSTKDLIKHSDRGLIITLWFQVVFFYFGFCFEFLIELLKKIKTLLFF